MRNECQSTAAEEKINQKEEEKKKRLRQTWRLEQEGVKEGGEEDEDEDEEEEKEEKEDRKPIHSLCSARALLGLEVSYKHGNCQQQNFGWKGMEVAGKKKKLGEGSPVESREEYVCLCSCSGTSFSFAKSFLLWRDTSWLR